LDCVVKNHPDIQISTSGASVSEKLKSVAEQKINPEFSNKTLTGLSPDNQVYAEFNLTQTIEDPSKRAARIKKAEKDTLLKKSMIKTSEESVYHDTALNLYRIRQIKDEIRVIDDVIETYRKIKKTLLGRPALTPDQKASVRLFEISEAEFTLLKLPLVTEIDQLSREIGFAVQQDFVAKDSVLPKRLSDWPQLAEGRPDQDISNAAIAVKKAEMDSASADIETADSESKMDYRIGPSVELLRQYDRNTPSFGLNFSMPLPFYHRNEARSVYVRENLKIAQQSFDFELAKFRERRSFYVQKYTRYLNSVKKGTSIRALSQKHDEIESFFLDGFIGSSPVLDIHEKLLKFAKTQDEIELQMIDALLQVSALDGKQYEVIK